MGLDGLGSRYETPWALTGVATTERQVQERASARRPRESVLLRTPNPNLTHACM